MSVPSLLRVNRQRKAQLNSNILSITFPKRETKFVRSLVGTNGGFLKLSKPDQVRHQLRGQLIFTSEENAADILARRDIPASITLKQSASSANRQQRQTDTHSLKLSGIPVHADISDVASHFQTAASILMKARTRNNFRFGSDHHYRILQGKEAVIRFDSSAECAEAFKGRPFVDMDGQRVTVTFGNLTHKVNKVKRKMQRSVRRKKPAPGGKSKAVRKEGMDHKDEL